MKCNKEKSLAENVLEIVSKYFKAESMPCGKFEQITISGLMKFDVKKFNASCLGNVCTMAMNMGIMKMETIVISPFEKNIPLISIDMINAFGKRKLLFELYNIGTEDTDETAALIKKVEEIHAKYADLADFTPNPAWFDNLKATCAYKTGGKKDEAGLNGLAAEITDAVLAAAQGMDDLTEEQINVKKAAIGEYGNGLIEKGGVSTDVFKKQLGVDSTKEFFETVFFGTK